MPFFHKEQGEIIVNKISTVNKCTRDITGHFASIAAEGPEGDDKNESESEFFGGTSISCMVKDKKNLRKLY